MPLPELDRFSFRSALTFLAIAVVGCVLWCLFALPQLRPLQLSIQREDAVRIASDHLRKMPGIDPRQYRTAVVFSQEMDTDRYLQKALGVRAGDFIRAYDYQMSYWTVRFFRPGEKEEYHLILSAVDGGVIQYNRTIDDNAARPATTAEESRAVAERLLSQDLGMDLSQYEPKDATTTQRDHRTDYAFSWKHRRVDIPWSTKEKTGTAKLLVEAVVSGGEVLSYSRSHFLIPDGFNRYLDREQEAGRLLSSIFFIIYFVIVLTAVYQAVRCFRQMAVRTVRPFLSVLSVALFILMVLGVLNLAESFLMGYPTSQLFVSFFSRGLLEVVISVFFIAAGFLLIALAGEGLRQRFPDLGAKSGVLFYVRSSFWTRDILARIGIGYAVACLMLGVQAALFGFGQKTFGVWSENYWLTQFSTAYVPALAALVLGVKASLTEEVTYRAYVIPQIRQWTGSWILAMVLSSLAWGLGHSGYMIFPSWFRCLEVTVLGGILAFVYVRYGLVAVLVAHYVFDVFWSSAGCLLGQVRPLYFYSSLLVLVLPLIWGGVAWWINASEREQVPDIRLGRTEAFNAEILRAFVACKAQEGADLAVWRERCLEHGWDPAVVEDVFERPSRDAR